MTIKNQSDPHFATTLRMWVCTSRAYIDDGNPDDIRGKVEGTLPPHAPTVGKVLAGLWVDADRQERTGDGATLLAQAGCAGAGQGHVVAVRAFNHQRKNNCYCRRCFNWPHFDCAKLLNCRRCCINNKKYRVQQNWFAHPPQGSRPSCSCFSWALFLSLKVRAAKMLESH